MADEISRPVLGIVTPGSVLRVHVLVRGARREALTDMVLALDQTLPWLNENSDGEAQWAEVYGYGDGMLLMTLRRGKEGRWRLVAEA
jgi:hypothetical protein